MSHAGFKGLLRFPAQLTLNLARVDRIAAVMSGTVSDKGHLLAIVAAITLTMRRRAGLKAQDVAKQVAVRSQDRVRIVKLESSKDP